MKNKILKFFYISLAIILFIVVYLSTAGVETDRFNNKIKNRVNQINNSLDLDLKKIRFTLDPLKLKIYAKTKSTIVFSSKRTLSLEYIKSEFSISSLIKNKVSLSNIEVTTSSILLDDFISFVRLTNNKPQLFLLEKIVKKGHIILNLSLNLDEDGNIKNDYEINGLVKNANIDFLNQSKIENINFNFNLKHDYYNFDDIKFKFENIKFNSEIL